MNYLTNYYKNLSEKLQHRVNLLENQAKMINEAVSTMSVYNRPDSTNAFGGSGIPGDYNGDGVVDGYDLGIALGNYGQPGYDYQNTIQNWTQTPSAAVSFRSAGGRGNQAGRAGFAGDRGQVSQSRPTSGGGIQNAVYSSGAYGGEGGGGGIPGGGIPGDYNGDGRVDGSDLGIALGNYGMPGYDFQSTLQNWGSGMNTPRSLRQSTRAPRSSAASRPEEMVGSSPTGIPGDYNGDGRVDGADLGIALGNYGQQGYDFNTTLQNWTGSGMGGGSERPGFRSPRPSNTRKPTYGGK